MATPLNALFPRAAIPTKPLSPLDSVDDVNYTLAQVPVGPDFLILAVTHPSPRFLLKDSVFILNYMFVCMALCTQTVQQYCYIFTYVVEQDDLKHKMPLKCQILSPSYRKRPSIANPMQAAKVCKGQGLGWGTCSSSSKNSNLKAQFS